ncbi:MmcQ/YjbR family DNA-binding protein [Streptococcus loxodontisalivarius]|uniref:DNA-binding protein (MmcQ/YjbR family) n=1 Tax=Streptococcus loxodontisalivarius TaxID=1349415 RepID=A0ABS2PVQ0_9STRE|nr:MmcQ/YjbR family DNA-binding protein [Streptococcus loxodontisalivarius]MBM7643605.1 putative DNA-binding protein (MmcQ/YjbR family) [Streptococcus loxodontisalivarius]
MSIESDFFAKKRVVFERLEAFGFVRDGEDFVYRSLLLDGAFEAVLTISANGDVSGRVIDLDLGEDYLALRVERATGSYVGQVRQAYVDLLGQVADACFEAQAFREPQTNRLAARLASDFGDSYDHPFQRYPDYTSYRVAGKWYALLFPLKGHKLGLSGEMAEQTMEVVNIKVDPKRLEEYLALDGIYPSYHMSKKSWISIVLDDSLSDEALWDLVSASRALVNPNALASSEGPDFWIIPANLKYYDIDKEFEENEEVLWTQKASIKAGDFVLIYITAPTRAVRYICQVLEADLPNHAYRDEPSIKKLMKLRLIKTYADSDLDFERLKSLGVKAVRGPRRVSQDLRAWLQENLK